MWLVQARKHILAGDFRTWKEMMVKIYEPNCKKMFEVF
jgi:hypothetical protein